MSGAFHCLAEAVCLLATPSFDDVFEECNGNCQGYMIKPAWIARYEGMNGS